MKINWWTIRHWWHKPQTWKEQAAPKIGFTMLKFALGSSDGWGYTTKERLSALGQSFRRRELISLWAWRDTADMVMYHTLKRASWSQPLCCKGDAGGWQTKLCEWMEDKAREQSALENPIDIEGESS